MKALNPIKFISEVSERLSEYKNNVKNSEDFDKAKRIAAAGLGYIDCMITFLNSMIDDENNDFTCMLNEVIDDWKRDMYQALIDNADKNNQSSDVIYKLCVKRDGGEE